MKKNTDNKICEINSAWLITWEFYSPNADQKLLEYGIKNKVIDIQDSHKSFNFMLDYTKNIYRVLKGSLSDKVLLIKRGSMRMTETDFFYSRPIRTSYRSDLHSKLMRLDRANKKDAKEYERILEKWSSQGLSINIDFNPGIYTRKVNNLIVYKDVGFSERIEWQDFYTKKKFFAKYCI